MAGSKNGADKVWIVHIGYLDVALPTQAAAERLMAALIRSQIVEKDHKTGHYYKDHWPRGVSMETIRADQFHPQEEKPEYAPENAFEARLAELSPPRGRTRVIDVTQLPAPKQQALPGQRLLLEEMR